MKASFLKLALMTGLSYGAFMASAQAQDFNGTWDADRFQLRGRVIGILADGEGQANPGALATNVDNALVPEFDITYFFNKNVSAELILGTAEHTVEAGALTLGDTMILPPTLTLQYHFQPEAQFSPYVGAGINYTMFYSEDSNTGSGITDLEVDGGFGWALQAGFDYWLNDKWGLNMDVKYVDLDVDVSVNNSAITAKDVKLDPWIVGVGATYKF